MKKNTMKVAAMACAMMLVSAAAAGAAEADYAYEDDNIKLTRYIGLTYSAVQEEVTDDAVDAEMEEIVYEYAETEQITEGTAQDGDTANIDYVGKIGDEAFDGGSAEGYDLVLGSGTFIPGFEDGVIGMEVGETKDVTVTFPEDYQAEDLAGKEAVFTVTLNYLAGEEIVPELTDEWVKENLDADSIEDYKTTIRADLEDQAETAFEEEKQAQILQKLVEQSEVAELDPELIEKDVQSAIDYYTNYAQMFGMEYADFVAAMGYDEESIRAEFTLTAENLEKQTVLLTKIAELEKIEVTDEDFEGYLEEMADSYGMESIDDLKAEIEEVYAEEEDPYATIRNQFAQEKVIQFLVDNAVYAEDEGVDESEVLEPVTEAESEIVSGGTEGIIEADTEAATEGMTEAAAEAATEAAVEAETESVETTQQ